jgi:putative DNA methylase
MKQEAFKRIGHLYPKVKVPKELGGGEATVIAWKWARTVKCPNPACGCEMPLASSFVLSKKKGKEAWVEPVTEGRMVRFVVHSGKCSVERQSYKLGRGAIFRCPVCGEITTDAYVKQNGKDHKLSAQLMAIVAEGLNGRIYISPNSEHELAAQVVKPDDYPNGTMPDNPRWFSPPAFGMKNFSDLFTPRQLTALTTFSDLVREAQKKAEADAVAAGMADDGIGLDESSCGGQTPVGFAGFGEGQTPPASREPLSKGALEAKAEAKAPFSKGVSAKLTGVCRAESKIDGDFSHNSAAGATAYGQAVGVYLGFGVDRAADAWSSLVSWRNTVEASRNTFARQALPMIWDYVEVNPFSTSCGNWSDACIGWLYDFLKKLCNNIQSEVEQFDAQSDNGLRDLMISTDPPYYDNIGYADLSDFFYVWLRQSLKETYPAFFRTMLVPKAEELVATPYRFNGNKEKAKDFFENGMLKAFQQIFTCACENVPVTIYYAFKQSESEEDENDNTQTASTGWETMLSAVIQAGFFITGTWPMRTERTGRTLSIGTNALASSIVLVCRKRPADAPTSTRRDFINALKRELKPALTKLQASNIAPVDLAQSAIGPGMGVYSRFSKVLEADGSPMSIRSALQIINQELDLFFTEQDGELDRDSRFCVDLFSQYAFNEMKFGEADVLARAKNTSVERLAGQGALYAQKGVVRLLTREEIKENIEPREDFIWLLTQQLTKAMETGGVAAAAKIAAELFGVNVEQAKALAYRLYTISERKGWAGEALAYNALVVDWPEVQAKAAEFMSRGDGGEQLRLFDKEN